MPDPSHPGRKHRPTQADVAKLAGVSRPVVSYVLSGDPSVPVAPETRRRVLAAIEELGYVPDHTARSLRRGTTSTVAAIIPDITNPFYPAFVRGIQDVVARHGFDLIAFNTDGDLEQERKGLRAALAGRVDGVVITPLRVPNSELAAVVRQGVAVVTLAQGGEPDPAAGIDNVFIDNVAMARAAIDHLVARGHTRIGMITGAVSTPARSGRAQAFREAQRDGRIDPDPALMGAGDYTVEGGRAITVDLLALEPRPTAIFAANDLMAMGAMGAIREAGLRIPQDVALIGLDDIPTAALVHPPLTTIAQHPEQLGRRAAELLFERLAGTAPAEGRQVRMPYDLVVRGST